MKAKLLLIILVITAMILALGGCLEKAQLGKPEVRSISHEWGEIKTSTTEIITNISVYNPNPVPLPLKDVLTEVYINDIKIGGGSAEKSEIKANSESNILISTKLDNSKIPEWWVSHIKKNEVSTMNVKGKLVFDLKITEFKYPIELSRQINTDILAGLSSDKPQEVQAGPVTLTIKSRDSHWGDVTKKNTEIITLARIYNGNPTPVPITKFHYLVEMNGVKLAEGTNDVSTVIKPNSETTITLTTKLDNSKMDEWWVSHIEKGERTKVKILIQPYIEIAGKETKFTLTKKESEFTTNLLK